MAKKKDAAKEMLLVASKVKAAIRDQKMLCAGDLLAALNEKVHCAISAAVCRAQANKRSTVRAQDV